ncbi:MFS transporter [Acinetobacter oleivorans]|uniref:MFS transporter n=1 Tax=Acinetobacter oleivorans TaxID=1148157 RepID=UPI0019007392|nr:MFS transporter [Acinetobacter oleivorans]MBJ9739917.1 MFS transporter [Acinetobacter oleivorans]MCU4409917.1 MFS transporter [Acinetobacter oleivorans]
MHTNRTTYLIYLTVFLAEFSFFFALPLLGKSPALSATDVAACLSGAVILESILMLTTTGYLERFSRRKLIFISLLLRSSAFVTIYISLSFSSWLLFFFLMALSKSISKPFLREVLAESLSGLDLKKALNTFSLCQNLAVFIAPTLAIVALKYEFIDTVLLLLIISGIAIALSALSIIYTFPTSYKPISRSPLSSIYHAFGGVMASSGIKRLLLSTFFCFFIMGVFITTTTLLDKISPEMGKYSGLFFSIVGIAICVWQGVIAKLISLNDKYSSYIILICGATSSIYLLDSVYIAVTALIAYSIYESVIIPDIYFKASQIPSEISSGILFSYILIISNSGEAFGTWITGMLITHMAEHVPILIFTTILCSAIISLICLKTAYREEPLCQS